MTVNRLLPDGLLEIMQCPRCGGLLVEDVAASQLHCIDCGTRYPVEDGIPNMLDDAAIDPDPDRS
ncbi:MAG: Trm112 family protein [Acidimicrobiia bacterium]|nr:Trm112 family protein [Acidimicrobiia bacterium]